MQDRYLKDLEAHPIPHPPTPKEHTRALIRDQTGKTPPKRDTTSVVVGVIPSSRSMARTGSQGDRQPRTRARIAMRTQPGGRGVMQANRLTHTQTTLPPLPGTRTEQLRRRRPRDQPTRLTFHATRTRYPGQAIGGKAPGYISQNRGACIVIHIVQLIRLFS